MSAERRSAFSRAVREGSPGQPCDYPNPGTSANCTLPQGHLGEHCNAYPPDATVARYSHQAALAELERARSAVAQLRAALESACRYLDKAEADDLMQGCAVRPQTAAMKYRALLAKLDGEGK